MAKRQRKESKEGPEEKRLRENGPHDGRETPTLRDAADGEISPTGPFGGLPNEILLRVLLYCGPWGAAAWGATCRTAATLVWERNLADLLYRDAIGMACDSPLCLGRLCNVVDAKHLAIGGPLDALASGPPPHDDGDYRTDAWWDPCGRLVSTSPWADARPVNLVKDVFHHRSICGHLPPSLIEVAGPLASWALSCAAVREEDCRSHYGRGARTQSRLVPRFTTYINAEGMFMVEWGLCRNADMEGPGLVMRFDARHVDVHWAAAWSTVPQPVGEGDEYHWVTFATGHRVAPRIGYPSARRVSIADSCDWVYVPRGAHHTMSGGDWFVARDVVVCEDPIGSQAACVATRSTGPDERRVEHWCLLRPLRPQSSPTSYLAGPGEASIRIGSCNWTVRSDALCIGDAHHDMNMGMRINDIVRPESTAASDAEIVVTSGDTTVRYVGTLKARDLVPRKGTIYVRQEDHDDGAYATDPWRPSVVFDGPFDVSFIWDVDSGQVRLLDCEGRPAMEARYDSGAIVHARVMPTPDSAIDIHQFDGARGLWWPASGVIHLGPGMPMLHCRWAIPDAFQTDDEASYSPPNDVTISRPDGSRTPAALITPLERLDDHRRGLMEQAWADRVRNATTCWRAFLGAMDAPDHGVGRLLGRSTFRFAVWERGASSPIVVDWTHALIVS